MENKLIQCQILPKCCNPEKISTGGADRLRAGSVMTLPVSFFNLPQSDVVLLNSPQTPGKKLLTMMVPSGQETKAEMKSERALRRTFVMLFR